MIRVPTEVVKQRSQTNTTKGQNGSWIVAKDVWKKGGLKGFYRGFGSTVAREVSFQPILFSSCTITEDDECVDPVHMPPIPALRTTETVIGATSNDNETSIGSTCIRSGSVW